MLIKQKSPLFPRNLALVTFGELLIFFSTKVNLQYLLYSTTRRCCCLHLIKQNYFLKTFFLVLVSKNVGERSTAKNNHPVSLLSVVNKVFEKLVNNRIVNNLEKCGHFSQSVYEKIENLFQFPKLCALIKKRKE